MKKIKSYVMVIGFLLVSMSILVSCTKKEDPVKTPDTANETGQGIKDKYDRTDMGPLEDQYLNIALAEEPTTLDASKASDNAAIIVLNNALEPLTRFEENADGIGEVMPAAAESWKISDDGLVFTFTLRDNKWSDGEAVTAAQYEYGIKRTMDPTTGSTNAYLINCIKNAVAIGDGEMDPDELGVKALDEKTLEITLENVTPYFLSLTYQVNMTPQREDIVSQFGDTYGAEAGNTLSNGPFTVTEWVHNSHITLEKNPNYWDADTVSLQTVTLKIIQEESARYNAFESHELDLVGTGKQEWIDLFSAMDDVNYVSYVNTQTFYMFFNVKDALLSNVNIRKAIVTAVDRDELSNTIWAGTFEAAYGWVPKGVYTGSINYRDAIKEPYIALMEETEDPKVFLLKGMEELGLGDDPSALDITLDLAGTSQWFKTFGEYLQQSLKTSLGINLKLEFQDWPVFSAKTETGDFQMGYGGWGAEYNDPYSMLSIHMSHSTAVATGWENAAYDAILNEASTELDDEKRVKLYEQAETILLYDDAVLNPVVYPRVHSFRYKYIHNMTEIPLVTQGYKYIYMNER